MQDALRLIIVGVLANKFFWYFETLHPTGERKSAGLK